MKKILLLIILHAFALNTGVQAISIHKDNPHMQKSKLTKPACSYEDKFCKNSSDNGSSVSNEIEVGNSTFIFKLNSAAIKLPVSR